MTIEITFNKATKRYGYISGIYAVDSLDMEIERGNFVGLLGPNGAGKSTALKMLSNISFPTSGSVEIRGIEVRKNPREALNGVGCLVDVPGFIEYLTPRRLYKRFGAMLGLSSESVKSETDRIMQMMDMEKWVDTSVGKFSKGMKQRIALGQSMMGDPDILIFDEPLSGLDPESAASIIGILKEIKRDARGRTVLMATHNLSDVEELCGKIAMINHGKLIAYGGIEEFHPTEGFSDMTVMTEKPFSQEDIDSVLSEEYVKGIIPNERGAIITISRGSSNKVRLIKKIVSMDLNPYSIAEENELRNVYSELVRRGERNGN